MLNLLSFSQFVLVISFNNIYRATACNVTHSIAKVFLSVHPSVCLSNAWIVTKRKKLVPTFLHHMKEMFIQVFQPTRGMVGGGRPLAPAVLGQTDHFNTACYKISLCKYCQRQSCKAFNDLSIRAKMVRGDVPYYVKTRPKLTNPEPTMNSVNCP